MTRLQSAFSRGPALVTFVTGGDGPTDAILDALVAGGADVIELGMPFTDPMADGPAIQQANLRSLGAGTTTADLFQIAADFRARRCLSEPVAYPICWSRRLAAAATRSGCSIRFWMMPR